MAEPDRLGRLRTRLSAGGSPEPYYRWRPGAPPARPPRPRWPIVLGVCLAIGAELGLYLGLRHAAVATMPAWAHRHRPAPWPTLVSVTVVPPAAQTAHSPPRPPVGPPRGPTAAPIAKPAAPADTP